MAPIRTAEHCEAHAAQPRHRLERFRVDQFHVIGLGERLGPERFAHRGREPQRVALAARNGSARAVERAEKNCGGAPLLGIQVGVARRHRQPIRLPHDRAHHNFRIQVQIARHLPDDARLLRVLAPEKRFLRLNDFEQLQDHGRDAAKMPLPHSPIEALREALDIHPGAKSRRINFRGLGRE